MAKSEIEAGSQRLAKKFASSAGIFLGVIDRNTQVVKKPELMKTFVDQFAGLLQRGFKEFECEQVIYSAFKDKKKEPMPANLFVGRVPLDEKKNRDRNLIPEMTVPRYHPALAKRKMPRVKLVLRDGDLRQEKVDAGDRCTYFDRFTLGDLRNYWESFSDRVPLVSGDEVLGSLAFLLESYSVADILWAIDNMFEVIGTRPKSGQRLVRVFDLQSYLEQDLSDRRDIQGCL